MIILSRTEEEVLRKISIQCLCRLCSEVMSWPVFECCTCRARVCFACRNFKVSCKTCKAPYEEIESDDLRRFFENWRFICTFEGCMYRCRSPLLNKHSLTCAQRIYRCPLQHYADCSWSGQGKHSLVEHLCDSHPNDITDRPTKKIRCENILTEDLCKYAFCMVFAVYDQIFELHVALDYDKKVFRWQMFLVGDGDILKEFTYKITFQNGAVLADKLELESPCVSTLRSNSHQPPYFMGITHAMLQRFCNGNDLYVTVKITDKRDSLWDI